MNLNIFAWLPAGTIKRLGLALAATGGLS